MSKSRNSMNARRFLWDEDEESRASSTRPMGNPRFSTGVDQSVNLMAMGDQPAQSATGSLRNSITGLFKGGGPTFDEYGDAAAATESEEYLGQDKRRRLNPLLAYIRSSCDGLGTKEQLTALCGILGCIFVIFGINAIFHASVWKRTKQIQQLIVDSNITLQTVFDESRNNAQNLALQWIVEGDEAQLPTDHKALLERYILAVFYFGSNGNSWESADNWMTKQGHCSWYGVQCVPRETDEEDSGISKTYDDNDHITAIVLSKNGMEGTIPPEFASLSNTLTLDFSENSISGDLPDFHPSLRYLLVRKNSLFGSIPSSLAKLEKLHGLDLAENRFEGSLPASFGQLAELRYLLLSENILTGKFPDIANLSKMTKLHLDDNSFSGSVPAFLESFSRLTELRVGKNKLTGPFPKMALEKLVNLQVLSLGDNRFTGTIPNIFDHIHRLTDLHLNNNQLKGSIPESIGHLSSMTTLRLDNNQLTGIIPDNLSVMADVEKIALNDNKLKGSIPTFLGALDDIYYLSLKNNQLTGSIPTEFGNCFRLSDLHLQNNQLTGSIPSQLGNINGLSKLSLEKNNFAGVKMPSQICALTESDLSSLSADCNDAAKVICDCCDTCFPAA